MTGILIATLILFTTLDAAAINKCTDAAGKVTYTDQPCAGGRAPTAVIAPEPQPAVVAPPAAGSGTASAATANSGNARMQAWLQQQAADERRQKLTRQIQDKQDEIEKLRGKMDAELTLLKVRKLTAANNLAGAEYEQSISTEMQAVTERYNGQIDQTQRDLQDLKQQRAAASSPAAP